MVSSGVGAKGEDWGDLSIKMKFKVMGLDEMGQGEIGLGEEKEQGT